MFFLPLGFYRSSLKPAYDSKNGVWRYISRCSNLKLFASHLVFPLYVLRPVSRQRMISPETFNGSKETFNRANGLAFLQNELTQDEVRIYFRVLFDPIFKATCVAIRSVSSITLAWCTLLDSVRC